MASRGAISRVMIILGESYPKQELTKNTPRVYEEILHDIDDGLLTAARGKARMKNADRLHRTGPNAVTTRENAMVRNGRHYA